MCFACEFDVPKPSPEKNSNNEVILQPVVDHLLKYAAHTPLETIAQTVLRFPELDRIALPLFDTYNKFLARLDDSATREHLEVVQAFTDDALTECPACRGELRKVFGNIGITFKGSGFYKTDSRSKKSAAKADSPSRRRLYAWASRPSSPRRRLVARCRTGSRGPPRAIAAS